MRQAAAQAMGLRRMVVRMSEERGEGVEWIMENGKSGMGIGE
jgi:hypothetical protein